MPRAELLDHLVGALGVVRDNPSTGDVRAYLGVPIRRDGVCLGSFCVVDVEPREWTDEDLAALEDLAQQVMAIA